MMSQSMMIFNKHKRKILPNLLSSNNMFCSHAVEVEEDGNVRQTRFYKKKTPKYERFICPTGLRFIKAQVTHPELKCTFNLETIGVKKNHNGQMYTPLGVMTKGIIIEVIFLTFEHHVM